MVAPLVAPPVVALSIAGSDSGGGAGIQADLKVFHRFGVFGTSAITAITAQNTRGVTQWQGVEPELVRAQIEAVTSDLKPRALKTGMLGNAAVANAVVKAIHAYIPKFYVLDPVLIATSGDPLSTPDLLTVIGRHLLPLATIVTPNCDEAAALLGFEIKTVDDMAAAAIVLVERGGASAALVKGGHLKDDHSSTVVDVWFDGDHAPQALKSRRIPGGPVHGTGCALSAAITARLALGDPPLDAVQHARTYVHEAFATAPVLGQGAKPLNHWA